MDTSIINTSWDSLPWKNFQIKLFQLQCRIYRTMQTGNIKDTVKFQKILLKTKSAHFMAIWETFAENKFYELDVKRYLNSNENMTIFTKMQNNLEQSEYSEKKKK
jgi:hypothetical protein